MDSVQSEAVRVSEDMRLVLQDAYGPNGRAVMFQRSNGHLTITRSGEDILNSTFSQNSQTPVCNLFLKCISEVQNEIGDGVKLFVFVANSMLNSALFKSCFNSTVLQDLRSVQFILSNCINQPVRDETVYCVDQIIYTFFSTRFTKIVANYLSKLTFEFVSRWSLFMLKETLKYFSVLCTSFNGLPLSESAVKDGFLFKAIICNNFVNKTKCLIKVYLYAEDETPADGEIESDVSNLMLDISKDSLVLFVTNVVLPDRITFLLNLKKITIAQSVGFEETNFLSEYSLKQPEPDLVVECQLRGSYVWLNLAGVAQFVLNAPNQDFASQYKASLKDCLKLITFASSKSKLTCKAGHFERKFALYLMNSFPGSCVLPPVSCRKELNSWLKMKSELICDKMAKECHLNENTKQFDSLDANFNTFLTNICSVISNGLKDTVVIKVLCQVMWEVSTKLSEQKDGVEFVIVKLAVLNKAISIVVMLYQTDGLLKVGKGSRLVNSIVTY